MMTPLGALSWLTGSRVGRWAAGALTGLLLVLAFIWNMRRSIRKTVELETEVDRLQGAVKADERMDHADIGSGASDDDNREWLRERGTGRRKPGS